jgi:hypothetical protein
MLKNRCKVNVLAGPCELIDGASSLAMQAIEDMIGGSGVPIGG